MTLSAVMPFYRCYRAYVRGKVDGFQLDEQEVPEVQRRTARVAARRRYAFAARYARSPRFDLVVVTSRDPEARFAVGVALAGRLGAVYLGDAGAAEAIPYLSQRIPVVLAAPRLSDATAALVERYGRRAGVIACGPGPAPPGAIVLPPADSTRALLRALHAITGMAR
jgi:hypothetical protein